MNFIKKIFGSNKHHPKSPEDSSKKPHVLKKTRTNSPYKKEKKQFDERTLKIEKEIVKSHSEDEEIRAQATRELGRLKDSKSVNQLIVLMNDSAGRVRALAAESLGKLGKTSCVPKLILLLSDNENYVVSTAATALGRLGSKKALDSLQSMEDHSDSMIATACSKAAARLRGDKEKELKDKKAAKMKRESEQKKRHQELVTAMRSSETIADLLSDLHMTSPTSQWLNDDVVVNTFLEDEDAYGRIYEHVYKTRLEAGESGDLQTTASRMRDLRQGPVFHNHNGHVYDSCVLREVILDRKRLAIYYNVSDSHDYDDKKFVTAVRLSTDEFFLFKDY